MKWIFTCGLLMVMLALHAQDWKQHIREGNKAYAEQNFEEAITSYDKAIETEADDFAGYLNKGDAFYNTGNWQKAEEEFMNAMSRAETGAQKASAWHNLGNTYMEQKKYEQSVNAYKEALKLNPQDEETRYNLAYAQSKLQEQQQQKKDEDQQQDKEQEQEQDQQKEDQKEQNEQNKDKQSSEEQQEDQEDQQNQQDEGSEQEEQDKQPQPQQPKPMKKEQADRLLRALEREEEKLQEEYNKRKFEIKKGKKTEKDW